MPGIETGLDRRGAMPYVWQGRPADLPLDPTYAISDDKLNANWRQIMEAIGVVLLTGQMCEEGTVTYGASTTTYCRLTLPDGFTEVNDWLHIGDGVRQWRVQVAVEREIEFSDADLIDGTAGTANYNTIQDDLMMWTLAKAKLTKKVTKNEISLGAFDDSLHGDDIRMSKTDATTVAAKANLLDVEHESDGTHSAEIIGNAELDKDDVLVTQGVINLLKNGAFHIGELDDDWGWTYTGGATGATTKTTPPEFPAYYNIISTSSPGDGIKQEIIGIEKDIPIRLSFYVRSLTSDKFNLKVSLYDGTGSETLEEEISNTWVLRHLTLTPVTQDGVYVQFELNSSGSGTDNEFHLALVSVCFGDVHMRPERSPMDVLYDAIYEHTIYLDTLQCVGDTVFADWDLLENIKVERIDAYARTAPNADVTIRLTNGSSNMDTTILNGQNKGEHGISGNYTRADTLQVKVLANSDSSGANCNVVITYRMR